MVCKESDLSVGQNKAFKAGDTSVLVYRLEDRIYATQNGCTQTPARFPLP
jgi:nitrite reductase/ring-hydroxylating ferredoxin subunit